MRGQDRCLGWQPRPSAVPAPGTAQSPGQGDSGAGGAAGAECHPQLLQQLFSRERHEQGPNVRLMAGPVPEEVTTA